MSFGIIITGIILGALGTLAFLILTIVALAGSKRNNTIIFSGLFVASLAVTLMSISEMVTRVANKVKNGVNTVAEKIHEEQEEQTHKTHAYRDWLKSLAPAGSRDSIANDFYDSFDMNKNVYCIPMVWPYRMEMNSSYEDNAWLVSMNGQTTPEISGTKAITQAAFDAKYLLAKRDFSTGTVQAPADMPEVSYILFEFATGKATIYNNRQRLLDEAEKLGYTGRKELEDITTIYNKLTE